MCKSASYIVFVASPYMSHSICLNELMKERLRGRGRRGTYIDIKCTCSAAGEMTRSTIIITITYQPGALRREGEGMKVAINRITIVKFSDAYRDLHKRTHVANCSNSTTRALHLQEHQIFRNQHLIAFRTRFLLCCFVAEQHKKRVLFLCRCCCSCCCCYTFIWQQQLNAHNANMVIEEIDTICRSHFVRPFPACVQQESCDVTQQKQHRMEENHKLYFVAIYTYSRARKRESEGQSYRVIIVSDKEVRAFTGLHLN